jgi:hypothetical protein
MQCFDILECCHPANSYYQKCTQNSSAILRYYIICDNVEKSKLKKRDYLSVKINNLNVCLMILQKGRNSMYI